MIIGKLGKKLFCLSQDWWGQAIFSLKYSPTPLEVVAILEVGYVKKSLQQTGCAKHHISIDRSRRNYARSL